MTANVMRWSAQIAAASAQTGTPPDVIAAIMQIESAGEPGALSKAGAIGLMQVMPFHFVAGQDASDPATNVLVGAQVLQGCYGTCGSWDSAAGCYFSGGCGPSSAADASGTTATTYIGLFDAARASYQGVSFPGGSGGGTPNPVHIALPVLVAVAAAAVLLLVD